VRLDYGLPGRTMSCDATDQQASPASFVVARANGSPPSLGRHTGLWSVRPSTMEAMSRDVGFMRTLLDEVERPLGIVGQLSLRLGPPTFPTASLGLLPSDLAY